MEIAFVIAVGLGILGGALIAIGLGGLMDTRHHHDDTMLPRAGVPALRQGDMAQEDV